MIQKNTIKNVGGKDVGSKVKVVGAGGTTAPTTAGKKGSKELAGPGAPHVTSERHGKAAN